MAIYVATQKQEPILPQPVGRITICGSLVCAVYKRPNVFHMLMMHLFFGWEYQPVQE